MDIEDAYFYRGATFTGDEEPRYSDREFIATELSRAPHWARSKLLAKYSLLYEQIMGDESITDYFRENAARRQCNTRLRQAIDNLAGSCLPPTSP